MLDSDESFLKNLNYHRYKPILLALPLERNFIKFTKLIAAIAQQANDNRQQSRNIDLFLIMNVYFL
jgi:hypothetical protein